MPVAGTTSQALSVGAALNDFYQVPDYQRGFVWEKKEVNKLFEDITREFTTGGPDGEYFIGPSVVCPAAHGSFEITDGQQRLTTIFLLLCSIKHHLVEINAKPIAALEHKLAGHDVDQEGRDIYRYRIVLGYDDSAALLQSIAQDPKAVDSYQATTSSIENVVNAYRAARDFVRAEFANDETKLKRFYAFLTKNVKTARIETAARARALKVFETVNHRGISLGSMDLLKNLIVTYTPEHQLYDLKVKWKELVDSLYISSKMSKDYARDRQYRFLLYFIRSNYKIMDMKEDALFDWFWRREDIGYRTEPIVFMDKLLASAKSSYY